ncbi:MAG: class II holin family protein, partial [Phycisphaerales bacterium]|nr:class II holin family protein [Phycisphaerales bacterium]
MLMKLLCVVFSVMLLVACSRGNMPDECVHVDYSKPIGPPAYGASGTLTGFGQRGTMAGLPGDQWIDPIKYKSYRGSGWGGHFRQGGTPVYDDVGGGG